jgi:predicted  nucleic acid-binding Zn-ribbon protein
MQKTLKEILQVMLKIQKLDMDMISLMNRKKERLKEFGAIENLRKDLAKQQTEKEAELSELSRTIAKNEEKRAELLERKKKIDESQGSIKKVQDYNRLTQEMTLLDRELKALEQIISDLIDQKNLAEEYCNKIKESLQQSEESSRNIEQEIKQRIDEINKEGNRLMADRESLKKMADPDVYDVYERLLKNKKDEVIVGLENRNCKGCHITLTLQHEQSVQKAERIEFSDDANFRKSDRLVFCEYCSRIHYYQQPEGEVVESEAAAPKRRRRRAVTV